MLRRSLVAAQDGQLLIEALIAMALIAMAVTLFSSLLSTLTTRSSTLMSQAVLSSEARPTLDTIANELQSAICNGTTQPVTSASGTQITFTTPDRLQPYHLRQISYTLSNGVLSRRLATSTNTGGPPWTMGTPLPTTDAVDSVTNATVFQYYDSSGNSLSPSGTALSAAQLPTIAKVVMTLTVQPGASRGTGALTTQSNATLRTPECNS